jgi:mRNA interferase HigB
VNVIGVDVLEQFISKHSDAEQRLRSWLAEADAADWKSPVDVKARYASASFLPNNRVVFNIGGNAFRLVVYVHYELGAVVVDRVGTHAEYDRWNL